MNIKHAKIQLKNTLTSYFLLDEFGNYRIPEQEQRPVFLMGPPGIGKTAIVKQVASEMGIGLVSYSITHHTRQSALGLPVIESKIYDGKEYKVSEYTMSEIIACVYNMITEARTDKGILFLDEINCVSETLTPVMLAFLQFKKFGVHTLPKGWVVVTAGNPTEYNGSAKDFDIVTWDRLKRIDIEPDFEAWKTYAMDNFIHGSIISYLNIKKNNFYKIEKTVDGTRFVTARGWMDLSKMIDLYNIQDIKVDKNLISQYIQDTDIATDFCNYYELYNKYKSDYKIEEILSGDNVSDIILRAKDAEFDERLSLMSLLFAAISRDFKKVIDAEDTVKEILPLLKKVKEGSTINEQLQFEINKYEQIRKRGILDKNMQMIFEKTIEFLKSFGNDSTFDTVKDKYDKIVMNMKEDASICSKRLKALFIFTKEAFDIGDEMLILVTELTSNVCSARFIARYGSDEYFEYNKVLSFHERNLDLLKEIDEI